MIRVPVEERIPAAGVWVCDACCEAHFHPVCPAGGVRKREVGSRKHPHVEGVEVGSASERSTAGEADNGQPGARTRVPEVKELLELHGDGRLQPEPVDLPPLPPNATPTMRAVADFYALVLGLRRDVGLPDATPFAVDWVAAKLDRPGRSVSRALLALDEAQVIVWDRETLPWPRTRLYRPGVP